MRHEKTKTLTKASFFVFCFALLCITPRVSAQSGAKEGEWRTYGADLASTRYRPFDQIDASNFSKLELAWSFKTDALGTRPEYKLEGTPLKNSQTWTTFRASPGRKCA
jgi:glucose dehydrogenase